MTRSDTSVPAVDERLLWDIFMGIPVRQSAIVAHQLGLYELLGKGTRSLAEVAEALAIAPRVARALVGASRALGLIDASADGFRLTESAAAYLLAESPTYFGHVLDVGAIINGHLFSFETVKQAVLSNRSQVYSGDRLFESNESQAALARAFTQMMHGHAVAPALAWPTVIDLSGHKKMLDIGGGSGIHAIAATRNWPELTATIFDLDGVCSLATEYIERYGSGDRVSTHAGDMWEAPYPAADIHLYADILHDWPEERCRYLVEKSFESLATGGRLLVHEMLLADDGSGPQVVAGYNITMLLWTEGQQFSGAELAELLRASGFVDVAVHRTFGYWGIVEGRKP